MIDIVTVVFREELEILRVQAESINVYGSQDLVNNIIVVVNDDVSTVNDIDPAWWGKFSNNIKIIHRNDFSSEWINNGWVSQQALKILGSAVANSPWAMVLDAKTILVKHLTEKLWDNTGRIRTGSLDIYPVFYPSRDIINNLYNIDLQKQIGPGGVPFFFRTDIVRNLLTDSEQRTGQAFATWFQAQGMLTEFMLYSGYITLVENQIHQYYNLDNNAVKPINICHSEMQIFDIKLNQMAEQDPVSVSVHRRAWSAATPQQRQRFCDFLINRGLKTAESLL